MAIYIARLATRMTLSFVLQVGGAKRNSRKIRCAKAERVKLEMCGTIIPFYREENWGHGT